MNMDIQALMNAVSDTARDVRSSYHITLGQLTEALEAAPPQREVRFDTGEAIGAEGSYRGHYADLAFGAGEGISTAATVLMACKRAATDSYEGYKGGDFTYGPKTPLWRGEYGCCGPAIVALCDAPDGALILQTKVVD